MSMENWNYFINVDSVEESFFDNFNKCVKSLFEDIFVLLKGAQIIKIRKYDCNSNTGQNYDEELKRLIETNKEIRQNIDLKLEDLSKHQTQYEVLKKDQKLLSQGIINRHEAYLMAKKYYKKFLKMYCTIECKNSGKQTIYVQFFTESKKEPESYSLKLTQDIDSEGYQLLSVTPKLQIEKEIQRILQETNDLPGLLCCIRQAFISLRSQNKKEF